MKYVATFLIVASAASLLACGKSEDTPAAPPPAAEVAQTEPAPTVAPEPVTPVVETPQPEAAPAAQPEAKLAQPAAASKPATTKPAEASPAKPTPDLAHGQQIYRQACAFCHDKGVAGAPKTGDVAAWSPRLAQGMDTLYTVALRGKGAMPAKGGNPSLADADVKAAVDYLVAQSR
ncbi:MAG TPA: c-type cytochrome [Thiobacillus sp.]|nr:c-type cytochrome [Thiobacillus sp.]